MPKLDISQDELPAGFWQSVPCPRCGSEVGEFCMYSDKRVAHTRHQVRDAAVLAAAKQRALTLAVPGKPVVPPRRRQH